MGAAFARGLENQPPRTINHSRKGSAVCHRITESGNPFSVSALTCDLCNLDKCLFAHLRFIFGAPNDKFSYILYKIKQKSTHYKHLYCLSIHQCIIITLYEVLFSTERCTVLNTHTLYLVSNAMPCFKYYIAFLYTR